MRNRAGTGTFLDTAALLAHRDALRISGGQTGEIAPGWQLHLVTSPDRYIFSIKDTTDPCHFAYFSDDTGVIYTAQAIS